MTESQSPSRPNISLFLITLTTLFGLQLLRVLVPQFMFILRDRFDWPTAIAGLIALLVFLTAFLAGPINRFLGSTPALLISTVAIGFTRLAIQIWNADPLGDMLLAATGVIAFFLFLPIGLGLSRRQGSSGTSHFGLGLLAAFILDLTINGTAVSYDLAWQSGWLPTGIILFMIIIQWWLVSRLLRDDLPEKTADTRFGLAITWLFFGPYIFLQFLIFANIAWVTSSTGLDFPSAFTLLLIAHLLALILTQFSTRTRRILLLISTVIMVALQIVLLVYPNGQEAWLLIIYLLAGQMTLSGYLMAILRNLGHGDPLPGLARITTAHGLGMLLLVIFLFTYYAVYDLPIPIPNTALPFIALVIILLLGIKPAFLRDEEPVDNQPARRILPAFILLLVFPITLWLTWPQPQAAQLDGSEIRVMTYNLHNGFDPLGHHGMEAIAQIIERENPDVVGLQEVSRGWVLNGSTDMLTWLARRLNMNYVYGPTADRQWGNAILTRLPIVESETLPLPTEELLIKRGFISTNLDIGSGNTLNFINTHYHHKDDGSDIRVQQSQALLDDIAGRPFFVISGDLNAQHGDPEIDMLIEDGYLDVLDEAGVDPGYTSSASDPHKRIDYLLVTPDLQTQSAHIPEDQASDHLPIIANLER